MRNKTSKANSVHTLSDEEDTIAAIGTPMGRAGIGIVRISGPMAYGIARKIFKPKRPVQSFESHRLYLGNLLDPATGNIIDEVLLSYMKSPNSYTREDVIEINSHSGHLLLSKILEMVLELGARLARPGEFTLRAFLNGRIDLTQAEAVIDLINSRSERGLYLATQQLGGSFRKQIESLREKIIGLLAQVEVAVDFPDEEEEIISRDEAARQIEAELIRPIDSLIEEHAKSRIWVDGIGTAIVGRVNAGKSSLLNRLLNEQRAIVTPIPGTTRDVIESTINIRGLPLRLMDTAGFGQARDEVERIGIHLTQKKLDEADFLLAVIDQSRPMNQDDWSIVSRCKGKKTLIVINKIDLPPRLNTDALGELSALFPVVKISALTGEGINGLKDTISDYLMEGDLDLTSSGAGASVRHSHTLSEAARFFRGAAKGAKDRAPMEIIALELKSGLDALGEIIGETTTEEVLERIFSDFCIGK